MSLTPVPEQDASKRVSNFEEVLIGYSEKDMLVEAQRCLVCKDARCIEKCPVNIDIPSFIVKLTKKDYDGALAVIRETNPLPNVCGRICTHERQCEFGCILNLEEDAIAISKLEKFAADHGNIKKQKPEKKGKHRVAIVGSGPSGLACAHDLNKTGHQVTIFEALHRPGGYMSYLVPDFRLSKKALDKDIKALLDEGIEIKYNYVIGNTLSLSELTKEFEAVYVCVGSGLPFFMNIPGEHLLNVLTSNEFLLNSNLARYPFNDPKTDAKATTLLKGVKTFVIGCNEMALDAARVARRFGSEVTVVYRKTLIDAPARQEDIRHAQEEGIQFMFLTAPKKVLGEKKVDGIELMQLMETIDDETGSKRFLVLENSEFTMGANMIIVALGNGPNQILMHEESLNIDADGKVVVNKDMMTSVDNVFAGGELIQGEDTMIKAMADGKKAALSIARHLGTVSQPVLTVQTKVHPKAQLKIPAKMSVKIPVKVQKKAEKKKKR